MATTHDELFRQALALGDADKGALIAALIHSLDSRTGGADAAWQAQIEHLGCELLADVGKAIPSGS